MKLICTGDLHLGRRPSRVPADVGARASASAAWAALVEEAVSREVDAVVLTGDVVDRDNRFFEAFGPLERGVRLLSERGIPVIAVAGNHDFDVLPRLASNLEGAGLQLLGRDGRWERTTLLRDGAPALHLDGWSFPREHVRTDPLADYPAAGGDGIPVVGVLHTDVDQSGSDYAPTRLADLRRQPVVAWLIGHVHRPRLVQDGAGAAVLNPGSPQPLDPGEPGDHSAWLVSVDAGGEVTCSPLPVARVRYDLVAVDLEGAENRATVEQLALDAVTGALERAAAGAGPLEHARLRLRLEGRTTVHGALADWLAELSELTVSRGPILGTIEAVQDRTRPAVDLAELARGHDPLGNLASLLLALEEPTPSSEAAEVLAAARQAMAVVDRTRPYAALCGSGGEPEDEASVDRRAREALLHQGHRLLDRLIEQRRGSS